MNVYCDWINDTDYLKRKSTEVQNMLLMEYDYATDIEVQREEAFAQGSHQKAIETAKNMLNDKLDIQTILKYTGLSIEEINALEK